MKESARYILPILVFVALILAIGTVGYLIIEDGLSVNDAFYMTVTAITPTQFDEVHKLSVGGRYFTVLLVFCGFGAIVAFATQFARLIIQSELEGVGVIARRQMSRRIRRMKKHYIVCGYGEIGGAICAELDDQQIPFVVIASDDPSLATLARGGHPVVRGNATSDASLKEAGIENAVGVIAVLADDADNLFIALAARELNPKILIIARGEDSNIEDRILRAGADIVVSPMKLGGRQIAELITEQAGEGSVVDGSRSRTDAMGLRLTVHQHDDEQPTSLSEIMQRSGAVGAAGIRRRDGALEYCPQEAIVHQKDEVVLITRDEGNSQSVQKQPTGKTILLADDHRALRILFSRKLASAGHDVIQAANGDEALRLARSESPELIVLDVSMPRRDGYQVCETLRANEQFAEVPIILYSGQDTDEFLTRGRAAGASLCIHKTSKSSELLERIEQLFAQTREQSADKDPHPSANAPAADGFDIDIALENVNGDPQLLSEMIDIMLEETPKLMAQIKSATDPLDPAALRLAAHKLKGALVVFAASASTAAAAKLEQVDSGVDQATAGRLSADLQTQVDSLMSSLQQHASGAVR